MNAGDVYNVLLYLDKRMRIEAAKAKVNANRLLNSRYSHGLDLLLKGGGLLDITDLYIKEEVIYEGEDLIQFLRKLEGLNIK